MKRTAIIIATAGILAAPLLLTACSNSTPDNGVGGGATSTSKGHAGTVSPAETSVWKGNLAIGVGDQQANDKITLPAPNQVQAQCIGEGDNLTIDITAPNGWHAVLTHGSQTVTIDNQQLNYPAQEFTTPQSRIDYDVEWNKKFNSKNQYTGGLTWDVPQTGDVEIQLNQKTPPHWVVKSAEKVNVTMHISCGTQ